MKQISGDELKKLQVDILLFVDSFCKEHNIHYWINCGTLIGAVRHKGYIPWDDDIDLGMLRQDYTRFVQLFNASNPYPYHFISREVDSTCFYPFGKILDTRTVLFEPDETGIKIAVNIDVFVYDNAPSKAGALKRMYKKRDLYAKLSLFKAYGCKLRVPFPKNIRNKLLTFFLLPFPASFFSGKIVKNSKKYSKKDVDIVGDFTGTQKWACPKKVFASTIDMSFEGHTVKGLAEYDTFLKLAYGNYMELPPLEKRVTHHSFIAYWKD